MSKDDDNEEDGLYFETLLMIAKGASCKIICNVDQMSWRI